MRFRSAVIFLATFGFATMAQAQDANEKLNSYLYSGDFQKGVRALSHHRGDETERDAAKFAVAILQLAGAADNLGHEFYRYGMNSERLLDVPLLRLAVPRNPAPDSISYRDFRRILENFSRELASIEKKLNDIDDADMKLVIDLGRVGFDFDGDGAADIENNILPLLRGVNRAAASAALPENGETLVFAFDRADAVWLRGYCNVLLATANFWLAHDFEEWFSVSAGFVFPYTIPAIDRTQFTDREFGNVSISDAIASIHLLSWDVTDRRKLRASHQNLLNVIVLSRENWRLIREENDDDHEWIAGPGQASRFLAASEENAAAWLELLDRFEQVLQGEVLIPHFFLTKGVNIKRFFYESRHFDLLMTVTGHDLVQYAEDGEVISEQEWRQRRRAFGGNIFGFAVRVN